MAETTSITIRLPNDVLAAIDHQGGKRTDALVAALRTWMAGGQAAPDPRVAELEAGVIDLAKSLSDVAIERDEWRARAKAIVAAAPTSNAEGRRLARAADPMGRREHAAGPAKASAAPDVDGTVGWCGLKGLDAKAKKAGR